MSEKTLQELEKEVERLNEDLRLVGIVYNRVQNKIHTAINIMLCARDTILFLSKEENLSKGAIRILNGNPVPRRVDEFLNSLPPVRLREAIMKLQREEKESGKSRV